MKIGILGSGHIGGNLGQLWARAGHQVFFSSRHPDQLKQLAEAAGPHAQAGTPEEAIAFSDVLFDAIPYKASLELDPAALAGKTLVSASNYYPQRDGDIDLGGETETGHLASLLPQTRVTKAFNMMRAAEIKHNVDHPDGSRELAIPIAGDDRAALELTERLVRDAKFTPVPVGGLAKSAVFSVGAPLYGVEWDAKKTHEWLDAHADRPS